MKTFKELITELLFAEDCPLLAHTEEALQHIVNHFSDAAKNFGLTISLKKTEMLYQPPPCGAYSPHTSQERQPAAVPELLNNKPHQSTQQSHAEDHTEQIETKSGEDHR